MGVSTNSGQIRTDLRFLYLSPASRYALLGMRALVKSTASGFQLVGQAAQHAGLPPAAVAKIFQRLAHKGLLLSQRGPGGGYALAKPPDAITLADILRAVQDIVPGGHHCLLENQLCGKSQFCLIHEVITKADQIVIDGVESISLEDLAKSGGWA